MEMHIRKREYLITGVIFLSIGLFGIFTNRRESLFVFFILGVVFLVSGFTRKSTPRAATRRHS
jgi:NADH:ubiquinone oxidoreductase subunit K